VFDSTEVRFKNYNPVNNIVGPGSYGTRDNTFVKKSFNMSMEQRYM